MAKKKTKRMSRKELKEKDQVLTSLEKGWNFVEEHSYKVVALIIGGVVVSAVWALWAHFSYKRKVSASRLFNKAMSAYNAPVLPGGDEPGAAKKTKTGVKDSYHSAEARARAALKLFNKILSEHGGHALAATATFYRANCLYQLGEYGKAIKGYKKFLAASGSKGCGGGSSRPEALEVLALENLAYAYEASGEYGQALTYFKKMEGAVSGIKKEWAIYHQARIWQLKGNLTKAIALYRRVKQADRHATLSPLKPLAEKRADYLEMGERIRRVQSGSSGGGTDKKGGDAARKGPGDASKPDKPEATTRPAVPGRKPGAAVRKPGPPARKPTPIVRRPAAVVRKPAVKTRKTTRPARKAGPAAGARKPGT